MTNVVSTLAALGYRPLNGGDGASQYHVELSKQIGFALPDDYREFLSAFPSTGRFDRQVAFSGIEKSPWSSAGLEILEVLYNQSADRRNDILAARRQYADQMP